ncbi:hypothetical protein DBV05_g10263 [Lasiodiplodia theobromae]|uniref:Heterokaryon incompatibility domain-containing protein n=1 Tax=Lasiodiplodia theobromae TaxID=45133 RepID=A0A5N5D0G2_9PEZI|nr:hypothetical protein DBV05_g10263 [Lasiodiplodia theobromae]
MKFAARLDQVRYIWIDSLCIIQGDKQDWFEQSRQMADIYGNAFLNIAATAATDSYEGLYSSRDRCWLWNDEIDLDVYEKAENLSDSLKAFPGLTAEHENSFVVQHLKEPN